MEFSYDEIREKLASSGLDEDKVNDSIEKLKKALSDVPENELEQKIEAAGGVDGIASAIIEGYGQINAGTEDTPSDTPDIVPEDNTAEPEKEADAPETEDEDKDGVKPDDSLNIISIDEDLFSDEDAGFEEPEKKEDVKKKNPDKVIEEIENGVEPAPSVTVDDYFNDEDDDIKVKQPKKKPVKKPASKELTSGKNAKTAPAKKNSKVSVKNMSSRAKTTYIIGLIFLIPLLIALVIAVTVIFLALYAAIIALVIVFSVALVIIAAAGTALSLMAIIFGVIEITQGRAIPGVFEIGLGIVAGGVTLGVSILLYNYIVRLAPFLFKKMFVLYKFLFGQLTRLVSFVKGVCSKL